MKKILIGAVVFGMVCSSNAFAASQAQNNTGCGLGTMFIGEKANDSLLGQMAMTTLNGIGSQTIGITLGTSECKQPARIVKNERLNEFVFANLDNLAKDVAVGRGESLDTLAELINIPTENRVKVYAQLQANFSNIFISERVEAADVVDNIISVINS